ncbi:MAG TPA: ATP-binding protein [Polyangium sp.]|nr:ATP-binding protein [Polyangium sp.]
MNGARETWLEENQRHLVAELGALCDYLQRRLEAGAKDGAAKDAKLDTVVPALDFVSPLDEITRACGLTRFERALLLLCAGVELDAGIAALVARAHQDPRRIRPTFGLALALLPDAHWSTLCRSRPLRHWKLLGISPGESLTQSPLQIDERVLLHLLGLDELDARLASIVEPVDDAGDVVSSQMPHVERLAALWIASASATRRPPVPVLCGADPAQREGIAAEAARRLGMELHRMRPAALPPLHDHAELLRLWEREALLRNGVLLVEWPDGDTPEHPRAAAHLVDTLRCPVVIGARAPMNLPGRATVRLDVEPPRVEEGALLWQRSLGTAASGLASHIEVLTTQFHLGPSGIKAASAEALARTDASMPLENALWTACRIHSRPRLEDLAQRIEALAGWDDLVLPAAQMEMLREIVVQVRHRFRVYDTWGFAERTRRGLGISALFAGPSGTGKTMAAEVLASELELDLHRVDLSQAVSKYIGETEKNLRRIFDAADEGGAILLFDEADALFGKRSEVRDSHDRYANLEVSYLLQRMEAYRGLAILTTNLKSALDVAFLRRLRFVVQFPFPDTAQRQEIWRRAFPARTPVDALNFSRLARVNLAGGNIRNIALNAAFMAAAEGGSVGMGHLLRATRMEFAKLDKTLTDAEVAGWL